MGHLVNPVSFRLGFSRDWGFSGALMESKPQYYYLNSVNWNVFTFFKRFFLLSPFYRSGFIFSHVRSFVFSNKLKFVVYYYDGPSEATTFMLYKLFFNTKFYKKLLLLNKYYFKKFVRRKSLLKFAMLPKKNLFFFYKVFFQVKFFYKRLIFLKKFYFLLKRYFRFFYKTILKILVSGEFKTDKFLRKKNLFIKFFLLFYNIFLLLSNSLINFKFFRKLIFREKFFIILKFFFLNIKSYFRLLLKLKNIKRSRYFRFVFKRIKEGFYSRDLKNIIDNISEKYIFKSVYFYFKNKLQISYINYRFLYLKFLEKIYHLTKKRYKFKYINFRFLVSFVDFIYVRFFLFSKIILRSYLPIILTEFVNNKNLSVYFRSVPKNQITASLVSKYICIRLKQGMQLVSTVSPVIRDLLQNKMVLGFKISCSGRFTKKEIANYYWKKRGKVSFSKVSALLDYSLNEVVLKYSTCGIKVWIQKRIPSKYAYIEERGKYLKFFNDFSKNDYKKQLKKKLIKKNKYKRRRRTVKSEASGIFKLENKKSKLSKLRLALQKKRRKEKVNRLNQEQLEILERVYVPKNIVDVQMPDVALSLSKRFCENYFKNFNYKINKLKFKTIRRINRIKRKLRNIRREANKNKFKFANRITRRTFYRRNHFI